MDTEKHPVSAQALETTSVCEIPFERLDELALQLPQLRRQLMRVMSREIRDDQQMMLLLSKKPPTSASPPSWSTCRRASAPVASRPTSSA
jgi:CRP/FNR family transcriptional regulator